MHGLFGGLPNERAYDCDLIKAGGVNNIAEPSILTQRELFVGTRSSSILLSGVVIVASTNHWVYVAAELADLSAKALRISK